MTGSREHWVFGYGSLMWDPGFPVAEAVLGRVDGYARRFCQRSVTYRGTAEAPGLVLGLDADKSAHCVGLALRVAAPDWAETHDYLCAREMSNSAYNEVYLPVATHDGRHIEALSYVTCPEHDQYIGGLDLNTQAQIIARSSGVRGPNADYLFNTVRHLAQMGVEDIDLGALELAVRGLLPQTGPDGA